ncbi:S1C family serine protease [Halopiger xanaduensis]|uniref:Peptidase S1 and S6 chymotrypsin/Hap n=1 Tax=Halopiger xanaduensis (strain DSM 18323 / JCM 14033 / SH-6) TaxID=797210 RepID=F8D449_HALXS|nr:trypsin-like peptidase domain-containing protein [Halopiger xanaduensis]AEH37448.1 peptidase S1 and S6 chymotrypsin/Hap [Halopiger xanaduensis SH-6]
MPRNRLSRRRVLQTLGVAATGAIAGCTTPGADDGATDETSQSTTGQSDDAEQRDPPANGDYAAVYEETVDSVAQMETTAGQGTGFVYDESHLVTNAHVVGNATELDVRFRQGEWRTGTVVGTDVYSDLAAVRVDDRPEYATPLPFIDGDPVVGDEVLVIGNPYGLDGTLTTGVVSGVNRSLPSSLGYDIPDAVQTDAAANPGNSGGPIVSLDGEVIAVINSGGGDNIAFGISAALAQRVVPSLVETGEYDHAYMGVSLATVTPAIAEANGLENPRGVIVEGVRSGGPSDGVLQPSTGTAIIDGTRVPTGGDVIVALNDAEIASLEDLSSYLALETSPDETISVTVVRDGQEQSVDLTLGARPRPQV